MSTPEPAAAPPYELREGLVFAAVSMLLGLTQGLGINLVNSNLNGVQGALGATATEVSWLTTAFYATNIPATLLLTKVRYHYGLRWFADIAIAAFLLLALAHVFTQHLASAIVARAALGVAAAPIGSLAVVYMMQAFPPQRVAVGVLLGLGTLQVGMPLSRILSEDLLQNGQWLGLQMVDIGLAVLCLGAIHAVRLKPMPTQPMFARGDGWVFVLYATAIALFCVVLTQGRLHWWRDAPWLGVCLALALLCLGLFVAIELQRPQPHLDLRWITGPFMLRFIGATLLFRVMLSEQTVGAVGLMNTLGFTNDQMHRLFVCISIGTVAGFGLSLLALPSRRFALLGDAALVLIIAAAWMDADATVLTRPHDLYLSQTLLAVASSLFFASAMLQGFGHVVAGGMKNLLSFIVVFSGGQALCGLIGQAWLSTLLAERQQLHYARLVEHLQLSDPQVAQRVAQLGASLAGQINDGGTRANQALVLLSQQVTQQSYVLAYNDLFRLVAVVSSLGFLVFLGVKTHRWHRTRRAAPALSPSSS